MLTWPLPHRRLHIFFFLSLRPFNFVEMNITVTSFAELAAVCHNACHMPRGDLRAQHRAADGTVHSYPEPGDHEGDGVRLPDSLLCKNRVLIVPLLHSFSTKCLSCGKARDDLLAVQKSVQNYPAALGAHLATRVRPRRPVCARWGAFLRAPGA